MIPSDPIPPPQDQPALPLDGIAIIGMAGRFPGAPDVQALWTNLLAGRDSITRFPRQEDAPADFVAARGVLQDAGLFDAEFFGISPREAETMDPQHRLFLEACANALDDAGYVSHDFPGEIGLFAGCSLNTYLLANLSRDRRFLEELTENYQVGEFLTALGNDKDFLTTRVAYKLNLRGPVLTVQGACATSLVAICQAAQALLNYQCDMALAGGVSVTFPQQRGHRYQEGGLASADGTCRPFDAQASGTVFGHGVGVILLKRLEDAVRDGDSIAAVIRGFAVNNDGAEKAGYMAPSVDGQARVIAAAHAMAGVDPATITYVEAHGTATPLGDPIEVAALTRAFRAGTAAKAFCGLGTAKGNLGHLDSAAGVTGVIKTVLSLQHRTIPALAHFQSLNPNIDLVDSPFYIAAETRPWTADGPLRAGVSAFGVGGVNAHIVLEQAPANSPAGTSAGAVPLCLSARTASGLQTAASNLAAHLQATPELDLGSVGYTLAVGRRTMPHRFAFAARSVPDAVRQLRAAATHESGTHAIPRRLAFLFPGQGSQFAGMGRELYARHEAYRTVVDQSCEAAEAWLGIDLRTLLCGEPGEAAAALLQETRYAQPALYVTSLALAKLLQAWGLEPQAMLGHSVGEYVAATLAQVLSWEQALRLVCVRGALMHGMEPGAMLSVPLGEAAVARFLTAEIAVAAFNSPRACVLSGSFAAIAQAEAQLERDGVASRRLRTSHAFHSPAMQPMVAAFEQELAKVPFRAPARSFVSSVSGTWITPEEAMSPRYWAQQVVRPVRFSGAVETLLSDNFNLLLECGPGDALTSLALHQRASTLDRPGFSAFAALPFPRGSTEPKPLEQTLAELWMAGAAIDWNAVLPEDSRRRVPLPTYPFDRKLHWVEPPPRSAAPAQAATTQAQTENNMTPSLTSPRPETTPDVTPAAPRLERLQTRIAGLFSELSGVPIAPEEYVHPFLELGFDSLFLTQATQALSKAFGVKLTFRQVMEQHSSIAALAAHLDATLPAESFPAPEAPVGAPACSPQIADVSSQRLDRLFADQLAAMSQIFADQVAALRAVAGLAPSQQTSAPAPATAAAPALSAPVSTEVRHGSFRPIQAKAQHDLDGRQSRYIAELVAQYEARTPSSKRITQASRARLADPRAVAGFRPQWKEMVYPLITDRASGSRIWDVDGNEYIDIVNGYGCILFGHSPEFVVAAAKHQLDRGVAIGPQSALAGEVAELICELTGNERVTFCNTGSEAVMAAIRVARTVTGRDKLVYFAGDYHGTFDEVLIRNTPAEARRSRRGSRRRTPPT